MNDWQSDGEAESVVEREVRRRRLFNVTVGDDDDLRQAGMIGAWRARQKFNGTEEQWPGFLRINVRNAIIDEMRRLIGRKGDRPRSVEMLEHPVTFDPEPTDEPTQPRKVRLCGWCGAALPDSRRDTRCKECRRVQHRVHAIRRRLEQLRKRQASLVRPLEDVEREHIEFSVRLVGDIKLVAKLLGIGRATLYRKLDDYAKLPVIDTPLPSDNNQFEARHIADECEVELRKREGEWLCRRQSR